MTAERSAVAQHYRSRKAPRDASTEPASVRAALLEENALVERFVRLPLAHWLTRDPLPLATIGRDYHRPRSSIIEGCYSCAWCMSAMWTRHVCQSVALWIIALVLAGPSHGQAGGQRLFLGSHTRTVFPVPHRKIREMPGAAQCRTDFRMRAPPLQKSLAPVFRVSC